MIKSITVYLSHSLANQGHQSPSLLWAVIPSRHVWRPLVRVESVLCADWGLCLMLQRALSTLSRAHWGCSAPGEGLRPPQGSAAISGLGWGLSSCGHCSGLSSATQEPRALQRPATLHSLLADGRGWQLLCLPSKAGPRFICLLPKIVWAQRGHLHLEIPMFSAFLLNFRHLYCGWISLSCPPTDCNDSHNYIRGRAGRSV